MRPPLPPRPARERMVSSGVGQARFIKKGGRRFDISDPYSFAVGLGWGSFALLFVVLEIGLNMLFASLYIARPDCIANMPPGSFLYAFFFSLETLATVGYGVMAPQTLYGHVVSSAEIICGIAFTAIMTGLTFVRFSRPRPYILYAEHPVVTRHNGVPTLMVRVANGRAAVMTDASARLSVLLAERTTEGQTFRRSHDLALIRSHSPLFAITWTLMHPIGPDSPLAGKDAEMMHVQGVRLFLTLQARDVRLDVTLHDLHDWPGAEVVFGMRYAEAVQFNEAGVPVADLTRISLMEPDDIDEQPAAAG